MTVSSVLFTIAGAAWLVLAIGVVTRLAEAPRSVLAELRDPVLSPFWSLVWLAGMPLSIGVAPYSLTAAEVWLIVCVAGIVANALYIVPLWIADRSAPPRFHPGYILPTIAGGVLPAQVAAALRLSALAWVCLAVGAASCLALAPVMVRRLARSWPVPAALTPTLAISLAPPAVGSNAYLDLRGMRADGVAYALLAVAVATALAQIPLISRYLRLPFGPSVWGFAFPVAAIAGCAVHWLQILNPPGQAIYAGLTCAATSALIGALALRTLLAAMPSWRAPVNHNDAREELSVQRT